MPKRNLILADNKYSDAFNNLVDYATGNKHIKLNTPKIELPPVVVDLSPETTKTIKVVAGLLAGAIVIHAISNLKRK
jgi:hypothetical protein